MFEKKVSEEQKKKMNKEAKQASKRERKAEGDSSKIVSTLKVIVLPLLFAGIVVCAIYLAMQQKQAQDDLKTTVVCMKEDVAANTYVSVDDIDKYFTTVKVQLEAVPENAIKSVGELSKDGFYIEDAMKKSQMVLTDNLASKDEVMDKYLSGYEVTSFDAQNFADGVNGSLIEYGWDVAVYSSIEHIYGYDYVTSCYKDNPQDSWKQIVDYMRKMYPQATDKKIRKILK